MLYLMKKEIWLRPTGETGQEVNLLQGAETRGPSVMIIIRNIGLLKGI
jgi:hypothetical protein